MKWKRSENEPKPWFRLISIWVQVISVSFSHHFQIVSDLLSRERQAYDHVWHPKGHWNYTKRHENHMGKNRKHEFGSFPFSFDSSPFHFGSFPLHFAFAKYRTAWPWLRHDIRDSVEMKWKWTEIKWKWAKPITTADSHVFPTWFQFIPQRFPPHFGLLPTHKLHDMPRLWSSHHAKPYRAIPCHISQQ